MLRSYLLSALRHFKVNKLHTAINISGLCIGIAASVLAGMFVLDELSFDQFHTRIERLYRLNKINTGPDGSKTLTSETSGMMGPTMEDEFPEVEISTRIQPWFDEVVLSVDETKLVSREAELLFADSNFFRVFDFKLLKGNPLKVLSRPSTIVLTENSARALFGDGDAVGKMVKGLNGVNFEVTGIVENPPRQSHIQFMALMSWATTAPSIGALDFDFMNNWISQGINTYILLKPGTLPKSVDDKFPAFMKSHLPTRVANYSLYLQPFSEVYLRTYNIMGNHPGKLGNIQYIYTFSIIAGFILFIACINYVNISTSRSVRRAKEVGMRKTMGASKRQLVTQFLGESFLTVILSALLAMIVLYAVIPYFNQLAGKSLSWELIYHPFMLFGLAGIILMVGLVSGFYPSLVLSGFRPSQVFKMTANKSGGQWPRYVLITFQFSVSMVLVGVMLVVYQQIEYVMSKDLGFDKSHVLVVPLNNDIRAKAEVLENGIRDLPGVESTSLGRSALGDGGSSTFVVPEGFPPDEVEVRRFPADVNFVKTYGMEMASGHFFERGSSRDSAGVVINEALVKRLGWADPLQKTIRFSPSDPAMPVIGVVKDFQFASLYDDVDPLIMWLSRRLPNYLSIRFSGNPSGLIDKLEYQWKSLDGYNPFTYYFLDKQLARSYESEEKLFDTVVVFASLSIFISCLGLYGLVSLILEQRTKEFGVRKVLGASITNLHWLVNRKFVWMVFAAAALAIPLVSNLAHRWIQKFAYRAETGIAPYVWSVAITLLVMLAAVSIQMFQLSKENPIKALRQE